MSGWKPRTRGADHHGGRRGGAAHDARLLIVSTSIAWKKARRTRTSLNGFLPLTLRELQLVALLVHAEEDRAQLGPLQHGEVAGRLDALDVLQRHRLHHVGLAREQRRDAGRVVADRREDDLVDVARRPCPTS